MCDKSDFIQQFIDLQNIKEYTWEYKQYMLIPIL